MQDPGQTRQELRAILANPQSSREQVLRAKLTLANRIADGPNGVREICARYGLSPEKSAEIIAGHQERAGSLEAWAEQEVQRLERLLVQTRAEAQPEQPDA